MSERYRLESRIATGGMGEVWRATDTVLGREVAVKLLRSEYAGDPAFRSRFETEARNAAALHHPNVASVFDFGELPAEDGGTPRAFLVMELVRGEPLSALLRHGERMPAATAADLIAQAADALAAAHDLGIVHRDVKPANLLVTPDGTVKITDFGIARAANAVALTQTGQVVGTPQYLSPEQAEGRPATASSDIYSLGVVLYECLAGRRPFDGDSPIATALAHVRSQPPPLPDDVPARLRRTVDIALAKDPAARYATVRYLAAALRGEPLSSAGGAAGPATASTVGLPATAPATGSAAAPPVIAPPPGGGDDPDRRRSPRWLPWVALAALLLVAGVAVAQLLGGGDDPAVTPSATTPSASSASGSGSRTPSPSPTRTRAAVDTVTVDEAAYLGRPRDDARDALRDLGLEVDEEKVDNPGGEEADTVADVSPTGSVEVGSTVRLSYFDDPPETDTPTPDPSSAPASPTGDPTDDPTDDPDDGDDPDDTGDGDGSTGSAGGDKQDKGKGKGADKAKAGSRGGGR